MTTETQPNVLVVVFDTARADAFEPWGAPTGATPTVADLATSGGYTPRAYAPASWTVPSHAAMLTGRLPRAIGLGQAPDGTVASTHAVVRSLERVFLPAVLRSHGYVTAGASCNAWISPAGGWDLGFDEFTHVSSARIRPRRSRPGSVARWLRQAVVAEIDDGAREVEGLLDDWLNRWSRSQPFFWLINLVECHAPYLPPKPWNEVNVGGRVLAAWDNHRYQSFLAVLRQNVIGLEASPAALARMRHQYARSIAVLDSWLERVMTRLESAGILDDTIVVITSDHGENFGEGGRIGHALSLDERLVRVPFVTHGPVEAPSGGAWSIMGLPSLLADAVGLGEHPWSPFTPGDPVPLQFDRLAAPGDERLIDLVASWDLDEAQVKRLTESLTAVTDGDSKLLQRGDMRYLYDLHADPNEVSSHSPEDAGESLRAALDDPTMWSHPATSPRADMTGADSDAAEVAALEEQMRILGYL